ncbi:MAG: AMP-binding protein, partial [bacterium]|nr:AMP-binding protein [bacterium]
VDGDDPAYIIYTSGTTGNPKGVMVEHRNIVGLMKTGEMLFNYNHRDIWTMFHSYCFDFSIWEMYGALLYGGKLVVIPRMLARDPERHLAVLKNEAVTILNHTPTVFYQLSAREVKSTAKELRIRFVIFGGEALKPGKLDQWYAKYPETRLINMYGITETTVHVTFKEIGSVEIQANISNIGKPISSLSGLIMNPYQQLQPKGVAGELVVGGQGVARGYLNRPQLTAERFITIENPKPEIRNSKQIQNPNVQNPKQNTPHDGLPGSSGVNHKVYRSGDLVRMVESGEMEYLGRIDQQVKIRGNRVETGEIERQMLKLDALQEVLVMPREDEKGNNYLCAYMRIEEGREVTVTELRDSLLRRVPEYMVPAYFIPL